MSDRYPEAKCTFCGYSVAYALRYRRPTRDFVCTNEDDCAGRLRNASNPIFTVRKVSGG